MKESKKSPKEATMKKKKGGPFICRRPDSIIEARFKLTKKQNDIIDIVFGKIGEDDDKPENLQYEIDVAKYLQLYNLKDKSSAYKELKQAAESFENTRGFELTTEVNGLPRRKYFPWFAMIEYIPGEGKIIVELGKTLKTIFLEVKRAAHYNLKYSLNFNCVYSKRLYYLLKLWEGKRITEYKLDELRDKLQCPASYKKYANFRRFVLEPAKKEINGNSDVSFEYKEIPEKNKIVGITFFIKSNKTKVVKAPDELPSPNHESELKEENENIKKLVEMMKEKNITEDEAKAIYRDAEGNMGIIAKVYEHSKTVEIKKTFVGFMRNMVKPGAFKEPITQPKPFEPLQPKPTRFGSYEQRDFDPSLEFKLLGWDKD